MVVLRQWRRPSLTKPPSVHPGEVVIVAPPDGVKVPRQLWPFGLILQVFQGKDGHTRSARIRIKGRETIRPLSRLYPLEVTQEFQDTPQLNVQNTPQPNVQNTPQPDVQEDPQPDVPDATQPIVHQSYVPRPFNSNTGPLTRAQAKLHNVRL